MENYPVTEPQGELLDHEFDGIREYDNPCPGWWKWIFFLTVVFAFVYFFYFHVGHAGITIEKAHKNAVADNIRLRFAEIGELEGNEATLLKYMQEPEWLEVGRSVYEQRCKSCHGPDGQGLVGPNLTDDYYKNVEKLTDIVDVVTNGAANGSMPAWKRLHPNEIVLVSAYVANMRGQNLVGPRVAGDKEIPPWPEAPAAESDAAEPKEDTEPKEDSEAAGDAESTANEAAAGAAGKSADEEASKQAEAAKAAKGS